MKSKLSIALILMSCSFAGGATLVGSFHAPTDVDPVDAQTVTTVTRTSNGNADTRGLVEGDLRMTVGQEVGNPADYPGMDLKTFSGVTQFNDLNRYGSATSGGLITWDFDLSVYLTGKTVGNAAGNSQFSLTLDYTNRRTSAGYDGRWFISYNGDGLTLDTLDPTTHTVAGNSSGGLNHALVTTAANYQQVLVLPANTAAGTHEVDLTSSIGTIAAGDGQIRIAYLEGEFLGDIRVQNTSGLVETIAVPEPATSFLAILATFGLLRRRR